MLIAALQNRYTNILSLIDSLFNIITPDLNIHIREYDNVMFSSGSQSTEAHSYINSIFISLWSSFDLLTKIAYELQSIDKISFTGYPKLNSIKILFGDRRKLNSILLSDTIFAYPIIIRKIQTIRDEIIHNGSLDFHHNIYNGLLNDVVYKWIPMPEFTEQGTFVSYNNRRKFYPNCLNTFNNNLPDIVIEVLELCLGTINIINSIYYVKPYSSTR